MAVTGKRSRKAQGTRLQRDIGPLTLRASIAPDTLNEKARTVEVVWTTGARVLRQPWFDEPFFEELSLDPKHVRMERLRSGAPLLDNHDSYRLGSVLGVVESATLEAKQGTAKVRFARAEDDPEADVVFRKVKDGVIRQVSVGYRIHKMEKVESGEATTPVYRAVDWEPYEISLVPMGADAGAGVRSEGVTTNPCELVIGERQETRTMAKPKKNPPKKTAAPATSARADEGTGDDDEEVEETSEATGEGDDDAEDEGETDAAADDDAEDEEVAAADDARAAGAELEQGRILGIQRWARALHVADAKLVDKLVKEKTPLGKARAALLRVAEKAKEGTVSDSGRIDPVRGGDVRDKFRRMGEDWLIQRTGLASVVVEAAKKRGETVRVDPGECRGWTLMDMARECLERAGVRVRGMDKLKIAGLAFDTRAGGYQSTSDFPVILEAVVNRTLLAAYATAPDRWRSIAGIGSVSDFKEAKRIRLGSFGKLDKVNESGEFKNKPVPDGAAETIKAETFGNIIAITRQVVINDDLGAVTRMVQAFGRAAGLSVEIDFWAMLAENGGLGPDMADGNPLFDVSHGNIGEPSALSVAGLDADRVLMGQQMDQDGNDFLDIRPSILAVPMSLGMQARVLNTAQFDPADATTPNGVAGLFQTIVDSPRLSGTRRYLFADPADAETFEVVFLDGNQSPTLESQMGWRIDGTEWKLRHDYGMAVTGFAGAVTNEGEPES